MESQSDQNQKFRCGICNRAYVNKKVLMKHLRNHEKPQFFSCSECGKTFPTRTRLKIHSRIHTGERPYQCSHCINSFPSNFQLKLHERTHTGEKPYSCSYCSKNFRSASGLRTHVQIHTQDTPYVCQQCKKTFRQKDKLKLHERIHSGAKPYMCDQCPRTFRLKNALVRHVRIHTGETFKCVHCPKEFGELYALKKHHRKKHSEIAFTEPNGNHIDQNVTFHVNRKKLTYRGVYNGDIEKKLDKVFKVSKSPSHEPVHDGNPGQNSHEQQEKDKLILYTSTIKDKGKTCQENSVFERNKVFQASDDKNKIERNGPLKVHQLDKNYNYEQTLDMQANCQVNQNYHKSREEKQSVEKGCHCDTTNPESLDIKGNCEKTSAKQSKAEKCKVRTRRNKKQDVQLRQRRGKRSKAHKYLTIQETNPVEMDENGWHRIPSSSANGKNKYNLHCSLQESRAITTSNPDTEGQFDQSSPECIKDNLVVGRQHNSLITSTDLQDIGSPVRADAVVIRPDQHHNIHLCDADWTQIFCSAETNEDYNHHYPMKCITISSNCSHLLSSTSDTITDEENSSSYQYEPPSFYTHFGKGPIHDFVPTTHGRQSLQFQSQSQSFCDTHPENDYAGKSTVNHCAFTDYYSKPYHYHSEDMYEDHYQQTQYSSTSQFSENQTDFLAVPEGNCMSSYGNHRNEKDFYQDYQHSHHHSHHHHHHQVPYFSSNPLQQPPGDSDCRENTDSHQQQTVDPQFDSFDTHNLLHACISQSQTTSDLPHKPLPSFSSLTMSNVTSSSGMLSQSAPSCRHGINHPESEYVRQIQSSYTTGHQQMMLEDAESSTESGHTGDQVVHHRPAKPVLTSHAFGSHLDGHQERWPEYCQSHSCCHTGGSCSAFRKHNDRYTSHSQKSATLDNSLVCHNDPYPGKDQVHEDYIYDYNKVPSTLPDNCYQQISSAMSTFHRPSTDVFATFSVDENSCHSSTSFGSSESELRPRELSWKNLISRNPVPYLPGVDANTSLEIPSNVTRFSGGKGSYEQIHNGSALTAAKLNLCYGPRYENFTSGTFSQNGDLSSENSDLYIGSKTVNALRSRDVTKASESRSRHITSLPNRQSENTTVIAHCKSGCVTSLPHSSFGNTTEVSNKKSDVIDPTSLRYEYDEERSDLRCEDSAKPPRLGYRDVMKSPELRSEGITILSCQRSGIIAKPDVFVTVQSNLCTGDFTMSSPLKSGESTASSSSRSQVATVQPFSNSRSDTKQSHLSSEDFTPPPLCLRSENVSMSSNLNPEDNTHPPQLKTRNSSVKSNVTHAVITDPSNLKSENLIMKHNHAAGTVESNHGSENLGSAPISAWSGSAAEVIAAFHPKTSQTTYLPNIEQIVKHREQANLSSNDIQVFESIDSSQGSLPDCNGKRNSCCQADCLHSSDSDIDSSCPQEEINNDRSDFYGVQKYGNDAMKTDQNSNSFPANNGYVCINLMNNKDRENVSLHKSLVKDALTKNSDMQGNVMRIKTTNFMTDVREGATSSEKEKFIGNRISTRPKRTLCASRYRNINKSSDVDEADKERNKPRKVRRSKNLHVQTSSKKTQPSVEIKFQENNLNNNFCQEVKWKTEVGRREKQIKSPSSRNQQTKANNITKNKVQAGEKNQNSSRVVTAEPSDSVSGNVVRSSERKKPAEEYNERQTRDDNKYQTLNTDDTTTPLDLTKVKAAQLQCLKGNSIIDMKKELFMCSVCDKKYKQTNHLKYHILSSHYDGPKLACTVCGKQFVHQGHYKRHLKTHRAKPFPCVKCDQAFTERKYLNNHLSRHSKQSRTFVCDSCGKTFLRQYQLTVHFRIHSGEKPYKCSFCAAQFATSFQAGLHERLHTGERPYQCQYCSKSFKSTMNLVTHVRRHKNEKRYPCSTCGAAFVELSKLKNHLRCHTGFQPFACDQCPQRFTVKHLLVRHQRWHTGNTFNCDLCEATFIEKYRLKKHLARHHSSA